MQGRWLRTTSFNYSPVDNFQHLRPAAQLQTPVSEENKQ